MMTGYTPTHIGIPKNHADFERKSVVLFRELLQDPGVKPLGRSGQKQFGIDLIGYRKGNLKKLVGIQCKKKKPNGVLTATEVRDEVRKALKYRPAISEFIIVTTADDDRKLDQLAQALTEAQRKKGRKIRIQVWGWGTLEEHIDRFPTAKDEFDPGASPTLNEVRAKFSEIRESQSRQATAEQVVELTKTIDRRASVDDERLPPAFADREIAAEISRINRRRGFPEAKTSDELAELAFRVLEGNLARGSVSLIADVLERVARSHARSETVERAKYFHAQALKRNQKLDTSFYDALLPAAEGDPARTLRALRDLGTPEARGAIFGQLYRTDGTRKALDWVQVNNIQITDLDAGGALNLLLQRVENGEFDTAIREANALDEARKDAIPALHTVLSSLLLASILPKDQKRVPFQGGTINPRILEFASIDSTPETLAKARAELEAALAATEELQLTGVRPFLQEQILWLKLEDETTRTFARQQVAEEIKDPKLTLRRVRLALAYDIPFNRDALKRQLEASKDIGNWTADEQFAALLLAWYSKDDLTSLAEFFDKHGTELYAQNQFFRGTLLSIEIEVLSHVGRFDDARKKLAEYRGTLLDAKAATQLEELIASVEEGNESERLRKLYETSSELTHLRLLVGLLMQAKDHHQLAIYAPALLKESRRIEDYGISQKALFADGQYEKVLALAKEYPDIHRLKDDFSAAEGWSYFHLGKVMEAREIARALVSHRQDSIDRELDINTAIESGDWGYLQAIVTREASRTSELDTKLLIRLATLAFESGSLYVDKFRDAAIERAPDNPEVFLAAYQLAVGRGDEYQETRAHDWFQRAIALSDAEGPVQQVKLKDIIDRSSGWNEKVRDIDTMMAAVKIPLYVAARGLSRQPIEFILGTALGNAKATNSKQQFPVLAFSGSRALFDLSGVRRLALDITAIFTLEFLGLLQKTIDAFDQVVISPSTLSSLFFDRQFIRFRQPSEVKRAREIKKLLADGRMKILRTIKTEAETAALDIDPDLQSLLDKARKNNAVVVRSAPVHKLGSLLEEVVDLSAYSDVLTDTHAVLDVVRSRVAASVVTNASTYFARVDNGWKIRPELTGNSVVYLDQLTVTYLHFVGILDAFTSSVTAVYVTQEVEAHCDALLRSADLSEDLLATVERIRSTLNAALDKNVVFSSRRHSRPGEGNKIDPDEESGPAFPSLDIMSNVSELDAVACDDRFLNKEPFWADGTHRVLCASTLDIILALNSRGIISEKQKQGLLHRLREGGYHAVPVDPPELYNELGRAAVDGVTLIETPELGAIRSSLSIATRAGMLSNIEAPWVDYTRVVIHQVIRHLWSDESPIGAIAPRADWLLAALPVPLVNEPADDAQWALAVQKTVTQMGLILSSPITSKARQLEYGDWIEDRLADPSRLYHPALLDQAIKVLARYLEKLIEGKEEISTEVRRNFVIRLVMNLHPNIKGELLDVDQFTKTIDLKTTPVVTFSGTHSVTVTSFVGALRAAALEKKTAMVTLPDANKSKVKLAFKAPGTATITFSDASFSFGEVDLLSATKAIRKKALTRAFGLRPLTASEEAKWFKLCEERAFTDGEYTDLVEALRGTPEHFQELLTAPRPLNAEKLVPRDLSYYSRLVGPIQNESTFGEYISNGQQEYRSLLVKKGYIGLRRLAYSAVYRPLIPFNELGRFSLADIARLLAETDPFTLVFGFELCSHRVADGEKAARTLGTKFLKKLFDEQKRLMSRLELFSACAVITTVTLRRDANAPPPPLSWYRLAVLAHAGVLTNAMKSISKPHDFLKWTTGQFGGSYLWHTVVDTREETRWESDWLAPESLNAELIGRCYHALGLLPPAKRPISWTKLIEGALSRLDTRLRAYFPGPLDGFGSMHPSIQEAQNELESLLRRRSSFKRAPGLIIAAYAGAIGSGLTSEIVRLLEASNEQLAKLRTADQILRCCAYIASTSRNEELARAVVARCIRLISADMASRDFLRLMLISLRACAAHSDSGKYYSEVSIVTTRFAYLAPSGTVAHMRKVLDILGCRDPRLIAATGRATAVLEA